MDNLGQLTLCAMRMSRAPQSKVNLPRGWRAKLDDIVRSSFAMTVPEFCRLDPQLDERTLKRAEQADDQMTVKSCDVLCEKLGYVTRDALVTALGSKSTGAGKALSRGAHSAADRQYIALAHDGLFDSALQLAKTSFASALRAKNFALSSHWANRVANACRDSGELLKAANFYEKAEEHLRRALHQDPHNGELKLLSIIIEFGKTMVCDDRMQAAYPVALSNYRRLEADIDMLILKLRDDPNVARIKFRRSHIRRQRSRILRLIGDYSGSLCLSREVGEEYPNAEIEAKSYARMHEADALRLAGDAEGAIPIFRELKEFGRLRDWPGLIGAVLIRELCALQLLQDTSSSEREACFKELDRIARDLKARHLVIAIYAAILRGAGQGVAHRGMTSLDDAVKMGRIRPGYWSLEHAHIALCRAELHRGKNENLAAHRWYSVAHGEYSKMSCQWGIVRSWIGMDGIKRCQSLPQSVSESLQGMDATLLNTYLSGAPIPPGVLSANLL